MNKNKITVTIMHSHFCYVLHLGRGSGMPHTYGGYTVNVARRLRQHNAIISGGAKYTKRHGPDRGRTWSVVAFASAPQMTHRTGLSLEWHIKYPTCRKPMPSEYRGADGRIRGMVLAMCHPKFIDMTFTVWVAPEHRDVLMAAMQKHGKEWDVCSWTGTIQAESCACAPAMNIRVIESKTTMIDPYNLLGVTIESTPTEVAKAYRHLALIMHPDKGGSALDMCKLQCAYMYVMEQVNAVNRDVTLEDLEKRFADFCVAQETTKPPSIEEIFVDGEDVSVARYIGREFDRQEVDRSSVDAGYGAYMAKSEYVLESDMHLSAGDALAYDAYMPSRVGADVNDFKVAITEYIEPAAVDFCVASLVEKPAMLEDYTVGMPTCMTDYRLAFNTVRPIVSSAGVNDGNIEEAFAKRVKEIDEMNEIIEEAFAKRVEDEGLIWRTGLAMPSRMSRPRK